MFDFNFPNLNDKQREAVYTTDSGTEVKSSYDGYAGYDSDVAKKEKMQILMF